MTGFVAALINSVPNNHLPGGPNILSTKGTATRTSRLPRRAARALFILSFALLVPLQPALADDGQVFPDPSEVAIPVPVPELPTEEPVVLPPEPVPTEEEEPSAEPVRPAPTKSSGGPAAPRPIPVEPAPVPPAAMVPTPVQTAAAEIPSGSPGPTEPPVLEPTVEPSEAATETVAAVLPTTTPSVAPVQQEQSQVTPVQAVVSAATGSPLGVQLLTVALLLGAGFLYFRVLGSKGMRTPSRSVK